MGNVTGGELLVRTLKSAGVEKLFGLHGAHIDAIFQSCLDHNLPIIDTRHEAAAGHAAEGYARAGDRLGVAVVTAGGGFTNVVTPIANAFLDRTPVLFIAGSGALRDEETNTLQAGIDQVAIAKPITKWAYRVTTAQHIPRMVAQAIRIALSGPRGPVLLDVPWDVLTTLVDDAAVPLPELCLPDPQGAGASSATLARIGDLLASAERPVVVVGSEVARGGGREGLRRFLERSGIPAFADFEGFSALSGLADGVGGLVQNLYTFQSARPDAVLLLGTRFGLHTIHGSGLLIPLEATVIQVDPDARELGRLQTVSLAVRADPAATIAALSALELIFPDRSLWRRKVRQIVDHRAEKVRMLATDSIPLHPFRAVETIAAHIDSRTIVVADGAESYLWLSEVISAARPSAFLCHGYLGSMGVGTGVALGAQALSDGRRVILVTGDGSVGYSLAEFDSMVRQNIPVIVVVMNNRSWGATLRFQQMVDGPNRITNTRLENGEYHEAARALGADGYVVETAEELAAALRAALGRNRPACVNVRITLDAVPPEEMILLGQNPFAN